MSTERSRARSHSNTGLIAESTASVASETANPEEDRKSFVLAKLNAKAGSDARLHPNIGC
jgi:hypothetical protein